MLTLPDPPALDAVPLFSTQVVSERRFILGLQPVDAHAIQVVSGGWERCQPDYTIDRHHLSAYALELITDGEGELIINQTSYQLTSGMVFVYGPNTPHRITTNPSKRLGKYFINTIGSNALELLTTTNLTLGSVLRVNNLPIAKALFDSVVDTGTGNGAHAATICSHLYHALLLTLAGHTSPYGSNDSPGFATYQRCRAFIEDHHATITTLEEVAQRCDVSAAYLCRLFQNYAHESPYQLMTRLRMQRAAHLLESGLKAKDVAKQLGFSDQFHFSRCFSRIFGLPPRRFIALSKPHKSDKI